MAQKKNFIHQFIPQKVKDVITLKNKDNPNKIYFNGRNLKVDYIVDFYHQLIVKYFNTQKTSFNLSSEILRNKYGTYYNFYIEFLLTNDLLMIDSMHFVGKKSITYKIPQAILTKIVRYKNFDSFIIAKYKKAYSNVADLDVEKIANVKIDNSIQARMIKDLFSVEINYNLAIDFLKSYDPTTEVYIKNLYSIDCIFNNQVYYSFDDYGRFHSNFTNLKSEIRKNCLTIDNQQTYELDIKNSQPFFLMVFLSENAHLIEHNEYLLFKELVISGTLYEYLQSKQSKKSRTDIKEMIYKVFFGLNYLDKNNRFFRFCFPSIWDFIVSYKKKTCSYKSLAYKLQELESDTLYNRIIKKVYASIPDIKLFSVHDSITFPIKYKEAVEKIFNQELNALISMSEAKLLTEEFS